jgi:hypothetical protein
VRLLENPIFITQRRLVHRAGVLPLLLGAVLIGVSMVAALYYHLAWDKWDNQSWHPSAAELGHEYYGWLLVLQAFALVVGGFSRISRTLVEERKAGLLDSNRLTPLMGSDLVLGYWLGAALREFYIAAALVPVGLVIVLIARLPLQLWLGTQLLLFSSGLFFGLLAVLAGMAMPRAQGGVGMVAVLLLMLPITIGATRFSLTNFLLPVYSTVNMFHPSGYNADRWASWVGFYGMTVPPLVYTLVMQAAFGCLVWRGAVRKFGNPHHPALLRSEVLFLYGLLVLFQYGLIWEWRHFESIHSDIAVQHLGELCAIHGCLLFLGAVLLMPQLLHPEEGRIAARQLGAGAYRWVLRESGPCTAIPLAAIACAGLLTQYVVIPSEHGLRYLMASANVLIVLLTFSLLLEICRLLFRRKAIGFFALALFVLYGLPFILSVCFMSQTPMKFSVLAPGVAALSDTDFDGLYYFWIATVLHVVIVVALAWFWAVSWRRWLGRVTATPQS